MTISVCDTDAIGGNEAVEALDKYINRLEKGKVEGLTLEQAFSVMKIAKVLRKTIGQKS